MYCFYFTFAFLFLSLIVNVSALHIKIQVSYANPAFLLLSPRREMFGIFILCWLIKALTILWLLALDLKCMAFYQCSIIFGGFSTVGRKLLIGVTRIILEGENKNTETICPLTYHKRSYSNILYIHSHTVEIFIPSFY